LVDVAGGLASLGIESVSASQISQYLRCPRQWAMRKVLGLKMRPGAAAIAGSGLHAAAEAGMLGKIRSGEDPKPDESAEIAHDFVCGKAENEEVDIDEPGGVGAVATRAARFAEEWAKRASPMVEPESVEHTEQMEVAGVTLNGRFDVIDRRGWVVDWKTSSRRVSPATPLSSIQTEVYSLLAGRRVSYFYLVDGPLGVSLDVITQTESARQESERLAVSTVAEASRGMALGVWPRNRNGWHCSKKWCGYYDRCMSGQDDARLKELADAARRTALGA